MPRAGALASVLVALNATTIVAALPAVARDLGVDLVGVSWVVAVYLIALAAVQPIAAWPGERFGARRSIVGGLVVFGVSSIGAALATSLPVLVGARLLQAIAGAVIAPSALGLRALAVGATIGAVLAVTDWRWVFLVDAPLVAVVLWIGRRDLSPAPARGAASTDAVGATALGALLALPVWILVGMEPGLSPLKVALLVVMHAGFIVFFRYEKRRSDPAVATALIRTRAFGVPMLIAALSSLALFGALVAIPLAFADAPDAIFRTGVVLIAASSAVIALSPPSDAPHSAVSTSRYFGAITGVVLAALFIGRGDHLAGLPVLVAILAIAGVAAAAIRTALPPRAAVVAILVAITATACGDANVARDLPPAASALASARPAASAPASAPPTASAAASARPAASAQASAPPASVGAPPAAARPEVAACADPLLTVLPVALEGFESITPLGNFNAPDHTIPTDHIYVNFRPKPGSRGGLGSTLAAPVVSPGRVKVESMMRVTANEDGVTRTDDFKLDLRPCGPVRMSFDHINEIAPRLAAAIAGQSGDCQESRPRPTAVYRYCRFRVDLTLEPGEAIGTGGAGNAVGIDIGANDDRSAAGVVAEPSRYMQPDLHVICPLDLFAPAVREQLYSRLGRSGQPRTVEPRCGTIYQDKPGTLQGNWFAGPGYAQQPEIWGKSLALAHDNFDPTRGAIVIGGVIAEPGQFTFVPKHDGRVDREFAEVSDGALYCYDLARQFQGGPPGPALRLLVSLASAKELRVERQSGACSAGVAFATPTTYTR